MRFVSGLNPPTDAAPCTNGPNSPRTRVTPGARPGDTWTPKQMSHCCTDEAQRLSLSLSHRYPGTSPRHAAGRGGAHRHLPCEGGPGRGGRSAALRDQAMAPAGQAAHPLPPWGEATTTTPPPPRLAPAKPEGRLLTHAPGAAEASHPSHEPLCPARCWRDTLPLADRVAPKARSHQVSHPLSR